MAGVGGGFSNDVLGQAGIAGFDLDSARQVAQMLTREEFHWQASDYNVFSLDLEGAAEESVPAYVDGRIVPTNCYFRGSHRLPVTGMYGILLQVLRQASDIETIFKDLIDIIRIKFPAAHARVAFRQAVQVIEIMVGEGWVRASLDPCKPRLNLSTPGRRA